MRARLWLFAVGVAAACGGNSPAQPSPPILPNGSYRLILSMSLSGDQICTGAGCAAVRPCGTPGNAIVISIDVRAERVGDEVTIRPVEPSATMRMNLRISGNAVSGSASGQVRPGGLVVTIDAAGSRSAAVVTGIAVPGTGPRFATGTLEGVIMFDGAGCSNNAHSWDLDAPLPFAPR